MIEVRDLEKHYGPHIALHGVSFSVARGEIVGLLGQNGAGKTTILRILSACMPPTRGSVRVAGRDIVRDSLAVRARIGYLPESVPLWLDMRVEEFLRFRARLKGVPRAGVHRAVDAVMDRCRVADVSRRLIGALSKGYRQRVGLADALVHDPELLILDEPTSGLDPTQRAEVRSLILDQMAGRTVLISTHILPEVERTCQRVVILHRGRIVAGETLADLRERERGGAVRIVVRGTPETVASVLRAAGVADPAPAPGTEAGTVAATLDPPPVPVHELVARLVGAGVGVLEVVPLVPGLEEIFARVTRASEDAA